MFEFTFSTLTGHTSALAQNLLSHLINRVYTFSENFYASKVHSDRVKSFLVLKITLSVPVHKHILPLIKGCLYIGTEEVLT